MHDTTRAHDVKLLVVHLQRLIPTAALLERKQKSNIKEEYVQRFLNCHRIIHKDVFHGHILEVENILKPVV